MIRSLSIALRMLMGSTALALMAACTNDSASSTPTGVDPVARVELDRTLVELELRDSVRLVAAVARASGAAAQGALVTWASSAPSVARVDASGLVTGLSAGDAMITATSEGVMAEAAVTVLGWNVSDELAVVDSATLDLLSDAAERASGTYRFRVLQQPAPSFEQGDVIVGAQDLGFLRRVVSASTSGDVITLETDPAALSDVIVEGALETSIDLVFADGAPSLVGPLDPGEVRWGAPVFTPLAEGVALSRAGINLSGLDVCKMLQQAGGPTCPSGIKKFEIKTGVLDFSPQFDLSARFSGLSLTSFRGVADGAVKADFSLVLQAETSVSPIKPQIDIAEITRPFYAQIGPVPVVGYVELSLKGGLEAKATAKGSVEAGFTNTHNVQVGASWNESAGWAPVFQSQRTFDAQLPALEDGTLSGQIDVETKLFLKPELRIIFYGVLGPFANVEPFGTFTLTFGTSACGMKSEAGINTEIGFTIPFLDPKVGTFSDKNSPWFSWPGRSWDCPLGNVDVSTLTNGSSPDTDGYTLTVDDEPKGSIGSNDQTLLQFVEVGKRTVRLGGVASNCSVQGDNPREVTVTTGLVTALAFEIGCQDPGGDLVVTMRTSGSNLDPDGYTLTVGTSDSKAVGVDETVTFQGLPSGDHQLTVSGVAENCVLLGPNPRTVTVPAGANAQVTIDIECAATQLVVRTVTSGTPAGTEWSVQVNGSQSQSITPNGQVTFDLAPGTHRVELRDLPENCSVQGSNPREVSLSSGQTTETFDVGCNVAGLSVSVATTGDPSPATSFTVDVNGVRKPVDVDGTVQFTDVPEVPQPVRLLDVPSHCLVQGENPRMVAVPGATTFEVVCQAPVACGPAPGVAEFFDVEIYEDWDRTEPKPAMTASIDEMEFGSIAVRSSMTQSTDNQSATIHADVGWADYWRLIPVDQSRIGERVTLRVRESGIVQREADPDSLSSATARGFEVRWILQNLTNVPSESYSFDEIVDFESYTLGSWRRVDAWVQALTAIRPPHAGESASALAALRTQLIEIVDSNRLEVPIVQMCTASGVDYR